VEQRERSERSAREGCASNSSALASNPACISFLSGCMAGVLHLYCQSEGARKESRQGATEWSRSAVRTCMNLDSDSGFELPGHDLPPLG
jgi:hypothetical protein